MHPRGFTASVKSHLQKQTWPSMVKQLVFLDSASMYLTCTGKKWISVDARRWSIFPKMVTYYYLTLLCSQNLPFVLLDWKYS